MSLLKRTRKRGGKEITGRGKKKTLSPAETVSVTVHQKTTNPHKMDKERGHKNPVTPRGKGGNGGGGVQPHTH